MKIILIFTGKTNSSWIEEAVNFYAARISRYISFEIKTIAIQKQSGSLPQQMIKDSEAERQLKALNSDDFVVLLDETGKSFSSVSFADYIRKHMITGNKRLVFIIGGAYGFGTEIIKRADFKLSLSAMTFSHQIVRPVFTEQLYRAFTIINNEPYHHA